MTTAAAIAAPWRAGILGVCALVVAPMAWAQSPAYDRYGPPAPAATSSQAAPVQTPAAVAPSRRRVLTWSGKDDAPPTAEAFRPQVAATPALPPMVRPTAEGQATARPAAFSPAPVRPGALGPPQRRWTDRIARTAPPPAAPPPTSIYAPAAYAAVAPAPAPVAAPVPGGTARYYSLHLAYGVAPDPAPIPPAFFGPTADFSAPETLDPVRRASATTAAASTKSAVNAARVDSETAQ